MNTWMTFQRVRFWSVIMVNVISNVSIRKNYKDFFTDDVEPVTQSVPKNNFANTDAEGVKNQCYNAGCKQSALSKQVKQDEGIFQG